jgi:hypothetical protein
MDILLIVVNACSPVSKNKSEIGNCSKKTMACMRRAVKKAPNGDSIDYLMNCIENPKLYQDKK